MKKSQFITICTLLIIAIICVVTYTVIVYFDIDLSPKKKERIDKSVTYADVISFEDKIKDSLRYEKEVSMVMVGDALIHQSIYLSSKSGSGYDFTNMLSKIKPIVSKYDIAYYNQETVLGGTEIGLSTYPRFNSPYEVGDAFIDAGFNMVSLANNHTLDRGKSAISNSINYWSKHKDVLTAGSYLSYEDRNSNKIFEKNGIKYTMLSYTTQTNGIKIPNGEDYLVNVYNANAVKQDIERVRDKVDVLMVAMHWGTEYTNKPVNEQKNIAKYLSELGVDIIIGCHPHVVEPVEFINNTLVIYSLGNVISSQNGVNNRTGLMMSLIIKKTEDEKGVNISYEDITARLLYTHYKEGTPRYNFVVYPYDMLNSNILDNYSTHYQTYMNVVTSMSDKITKYPLNP